MKLIDSVRPDTIEDACNTLRELGEDGIALAGGTSFHFLKDSKPKTAVQLSELKLAGVREDEDGYIIGAMTPLADLMHFRADNWAFHETVRRTSTHQIRNISTVGGNISRVFPWSDLPVALLAKNATIKTTDGTAQFIQSADDFFAAQPAKDLKGGRLLTAVRVPKLVAQNGFGYHKEVITASGFSLLTVAATLCVNNGHIEGPRIAAGAAISFPSRLTEIEETLTGCEVNADAIREALKEPVRKIPWKGKEGQSDEYTAHLAQTRLRDIILHAAKKAEERTA